MCIKYGPYKNPKMLVVPFQSEEIDLFQRDMSEEDMAQEDVSHVIINEDDNIVDVEA